MSTPPPVSIDELLAQAGWVRRLALRLARDAQSADDLAQGAMVAALVSPPRGGRPLRPWLARVLTNLARKENRGSVRRENRELEAARPDPSQPSADLLIEEFEEQQRLARQVAALRDPYRRVVLLHYYRGQSAAEIAASQGIPAATVRSQLARGLAQLRERLAVEAGGESDRLRSNLWLAAGLMGPGGLDRLSVDAAAAGTSTTLSIPSLLLMSSGTKTLAACFTLAAVVTSMIGWRVLRSPEPLSPKLGVAPVQADVELDSVEAAGPALTAQAGPTRRAADPTVSDEANEKADATGNLGEEPVKETTGFYGRVVNSNGAPVVGAAFASVDQLGAPRGLGEATVSGPDGRVHIELPRKAFFTYMGRNVSNTHLALCAPGHAAQFSVPAATLGSDKDLGDLVLLPGTTVQGVVVDDAGAPVAGALVVGVGAAAGGVEIADAAFVTGPDREGGRPTTRTANDGSFSLDGMAAGIGQVWAGAPMQRWAVSDTFDLEASTMLRGVTLVVEPLSASAMIQGVVEDPMGAPVPGAKIIYRHPRTVNKETVVADSQGVFRITIPEGLACRMRAYPPDDEFGPSAETVADAGNAQLRIGLTERRVLQLLVVSQKDGKPIEKAAIMAKPELEGSYFLDARWSRTDVNGRVELVLPGEPFRISVGGSGWKYQHFGLYQPPSAPLQLKVELVGLPMIRGVVMADGKPAENVEVTLTTDCSARFRPLASGFPLRLFNNGSAPVKTDNEGRFAIPVQDNTEEATVLLFRKQGYAIFEQVLGMVDPAQGIDGVEIELIAGGSLEGTVIVGEGRSPAAKVVAISRGDGYPRFARPGLDGHYAFTNLTPGDWQVDDRDVEPEGRVFGMAMGDEHPYRWDCRVVAGETTIHDLDLRWQDDLRVEGRVTWNGKPVQGWIADLQAPDHADRPWAPRPVTLDADGHFSLEAKPGGAKLILRSPGSDEVRMLIERTIEVGRDSGLHDFAFAAGTLQGKVLEAEARLRLFHPIDHQTRLEVHFEAKADGSFIVPLAPAGQSSFQGILKEGSGKPRFGMGWSGLEMIDIRAGEITEIDLTE